MWNWLVALVMAAAALLPGQVPGPGPASVRSPAAPTASDSAGLPGAVQRFWVKDRHRYASPWYAGRHRTMIAFGCTAAPFYDPDPRCRFGRGFHHGLDIAMACGTRLYAGFRGRVVERDSAGALGAAYGPEAFRIRNHRRDVDVVLGHVKAVYVEPGDRVHRGDLLARANKLGAPDGCHLHFEVRPIGSGYADAVPPQGYLALRR